MSRNTIPSTYRVNTGSHTYVDLEAVKASIENARQCRVQCDYDGAERYLRSIFNALKVSTTHARLSPATHRAESALHRTTKVRFRGPLQRAKRSSRYPIAPLLMLESSHSPTPRSDLVPLQLFVVQQMGAKAQVWEGKLLKLQDKAMSLHVPVADPMAWPSDLHPGIEEAILEESPHGSAGFGGSRLSLRSPGSPRREPVYERYRMEEVAAQYEQAAGQTNSRRLLPCCMLTVPTCLL
jgi:hypothetical protein